MHDLIVAHDRAVAPRLEVADNAGRSLVNDVLADVVIDRGREATGLVDRHHNRNAGSVARREIVLAETRCHMDDSGAVVGRDEVTA